MCLVAQSCPTLATLWTVACQAPLSMGFSKQEYWSGLPFPSSVVYIYLCIWTTTMNKIYTYVHIWGLPSWLSGKKSACQTEDMGSIPGSGRSPGERKSNPFQYSCLRNCMDRGAWRPTVLGLQRVGYDLMAKQQPQYIFYIGMYVCP